MSLYQPNLEDRDRSRRHAGVQEEAQSGRDMGFG